MEKLKEVKKTEDLKNVEQGEAVYVLVRVGTVKTQNTEFQTFKMLMDGKAVDLRFRKNSERVPELVDGTYKMAVADIGKMVNSWYDRYYATYKFVALE